MKSWYRLIDPALADPANTYAKKLMVTIRNAIDQAEKFHTKTCRIELVGTGYFNVMGQNIIHHPDSANPSCESSGG